MKNSGLFPNMAKWCFGGLFFGGFNIKRFVFGGSGIVSKVLKMLGFPSFWVFFLGWLIVVHLGLEGLGVVVFLVFVFLFCLAFVSVLFALFLALWLDVVVLFFCVFCLLFFLLFCFFSCLVFLEGLRSGEVAQRATSLGPEPSLFYLFCFFCFCFLFVSFCFFVVFLFVFLEGLRVR